jgi:hypothetical protein
MSEHSPFPDATASGENGDHPTIDLTQPADSTTPEATDVIELTDRIDDDSEAIIELTHVIGPDALEPEDFPSEEPLVCDDGSETTGDEAASDAGRQADPEDNAPPPKVQAEEIAFGELAFSEVDITDSFSDEISNTLDFNLDAGIMPDTADEADPMDFNLTATDWTDALDSGEAADTLSGVDTPNDLIENAGQVIDPDMIEVAVEKIIRRRFADKIDLLIEAAIEKTVASEIERLKKRLLGDGDTAE